MNKIKKILCAIFEHPHVVTNCMGYKYCARCEAQVGESLGGVWTGKGYVIVGHNCKECKKAMKNLKWHEKLLTNFNLD